MVKKVAINGFGRIGRLFFKMAFEDPEIEVVGINDISNLKISAHLLKYDSTFGKWNHDIKVEDDPKALVIDGKKIPFFAIRNPKDLPWGKLDVDIAYESTGIFRTKEKFSWHLEAGAKKVFVSAPAPETDLTVVYGVNSDKMTPEMKSISGASCTTNCLAPVIKVLNDKWGVKRGVMTTIHAVTNDQNVLDFGHKDLRRARASCFNLIPTTTGAAKAIGLVIPELNGKLEGMAIRAPVIDGSMVDLKVEVNKACTPDEINAAMKEASEGELKDTLGYTEEPLVSSDIIGTNYGSLFDSGFTKVMEGTFVSLLTWYDNEQSFTAQSLRTVKKM